MSNDKTKGQKHHERRGGPRRSQCLSMLNAASRDGAAATPDRRPVLRLTHLAGGNRFGQARRADPTPGPRLV